MDQNLFRKVSLDRLSSPEQLDMLMRITGPIGWLALAALAVIFTSAIVWGFFGSIATVVTGTGIFVKSGGILDISAQQTGRIYDIRVLPGDILQAGQVVARIEQPDLTIQLQNAKSELSVLNEQYRQLQEIISITSKQQAEYFGKQRKAYIEKIETTEKQQKWLQEKIGDQQELLKDGLITKQDLISTQLQYDTSIGDILQYQSQIQQLQTQQVQNENDNQQKLLNLNTQIREKEAEVQKVLNQFRVTSVILSPHSGKVVSVMARVGSLVQQGTPVLNIEPHGKNVFNLSAMIYVSSGDAKKIRQGMEVQLSPATAKKDEYGTMLAMAWYISLYPATFDEMMNLLQNKTLVNDLMKNGAPFHIRVALTPSTTSASGYKWSSDRGNKVIVNPGTLCSASFVVEEQRPISLLVPLLKRYIYGT